ncbi:MAG: hypothetical protein AB7P14_24045 [Blastocatellales bacterium]
MPFFKNRGPSKKRHSGSGRPGGGKPGQGGRGGKPGGKPSGKSGGKFGKPFGKKKSAKKKKVVKKKLVKKDNFPNIENTGMEGYYFKELIEAGQLVALKLTNGEEVRGYVRYYDKDTISIGPDDGSPKMFLRKDGIRYMYEVEEEYV